MLEAAWKRAALLYNQERWDLAEKELRAVLAQEPDFAPAHAMLGMVLSQTGDMDEALASVRKSVSIDPEYDFGFRAMAGVHMQRNEPKEAVTAITTAIDIDPEDADHRGLLATIHYSQERWPEALAAADAGLAIDPQETDCLNMRSLALTKLGRSEEATASVDESLAHDPDNPYTHQARGFSMLHQGKAKEALHHFQEALRRDPTLDGARAGLVEAIKTHNPIYRWVLAPFMWMERFPPQKRTQILIGAWLLAQVGRSSLAGAGYDGAAMVVSYSWLSIVLLTACIVPIFNLLLLLHPVGRHALDASSKWHAILLGVAMATTAGWFIGANYSETPWMAPSAWFWLIYLLPIAGLGLFHGGWGRWVQITICVGLLIAWLIWVWMVDNYEPPPPAFDAQPTTPTGQWRSAVGVAPVATDEKLETLRSMFSTMLLTAAFSTWFLLLGPKGHRPRRR